MIFEASFIKKAAIRIGFDICGIAENRNLDTEHAFFGSWLAEGMDGELEYMRRNIGKRFSPAELVAGAKSIVVCGVNYKNAVSAGYPGGCGTPKVSSYALSEDYHGIVKDMLRRLAAELEREYGKFGFRVFCDSAPVLEKRWAVEAGLGWQGRNSLVVTPRSGSFIFLGELVADAACDAYDKPYEGKGCADCRLCIGACPNGAVTAGRHIDARRCISRATVEKSSGVGRQVPLHGWIYGCDECQSVCPYNVSAPCHANEAFAPLFDPRELTDEYWLSLSEGEFREKFGNTAICRTGLSKIKENVRER